MDTQGSSSGLVKVSVAFEPEDYLWVLKRSTELFGRRGIGLYVRQLIREDKEFQETGKFKDAEALRTP